MESSKIAKIEFELMDESSRPMISELFQENWGLDALICKGKVYPLKELEAILAFDDDKLVGVLTYQLQQNNLAIISVDSFEEGRGIGTGLLRSAIEQATFFNCKKAWLVTTNDNINAIRFYQKNNFKLKKVHMYSVQKARILKPAIPEKGYQGIPVLHEIELEYIF